MTKWLYGKCQHRSIERYVLFNIYPKLCKTDDKSQRTYLSFRYFCIPQMCEITCLIKMAHQNKIYNKKIVFNNILLTKQNALPESLFQQCCFTFLIVMASKILSYWQETTSSNICYIRLWWLIRLKSVFTDLWSPKRNHCLWKLKDILCSFLYDIQTTLGKKKLLVYADEIMTNKWCHVLC